MIDLKLLETRIVEVFQNQKGLHFAKNVTEFKDSEGNFIADHINFLIAEEKDDDAPLIFSIVTPFDAVSKKAPQQAVTFHRGKAQASIDYTEHADIRTGIMDAIVLKRAFDSLADKKVLLVGSGKTAKWSVQCLSVLTPDINTIFYTNTSGPKSELEADLTDAIKLEYVKDPEPKAYDVVICHTSSKEAVFSVEQLSQMKPGSFLSYYNKAEIPEDFLSKASHVIFDWQGNVDDGTNKYFLSDLISGKSLDSAGVIVFKSSGTPLQNYAVLKILYDEEN